MNSNKDLTELRRIRKLLDLTLDKVSAMTGVSIGYLNRIERGYITDIKNHKKEQAVLEFICRNLKKSNREAQNLVK